LQNEKVAFLLIRIYAPLLRWWLCPWVDIGKQERMNFMYLCRVREETFIKFEFAKLLMNSCCEELCI
jgi:hypothetical protein